MRNVFERLERLEIDYYITGSEALGRYGEPRQTMDVDIVLDVDAAGFEPVARTFTGEYVIAEPVDFGGHWMACVMPLSGLGKADLILRRSDAWGRSAMERRERWQHPGFGMVWIITLEDLLIAKLEWSEGTSELQLRDCRNLVVVNRSLIDWPYVERFARTLGSAHCWTGFVMRPDPGRALMDRRIAEIPPEQRVTYGAALRHKGHLLVWQQSDGAGPMSELDRAMFIIDRLYPEMPPQHREQFREKLAALAAAGTWHGFRRP